MGESSCRSHFEGPKKNNTELMLEMIQDIPNIGMYPLTYVLEVMKIQHKPNTLWLEFGVYEGKTINYISQFTENTVFGFDSFVGIPEAWREGFEQFHFNRDGVLPPVRDNVFLVKGWFNESLPWFIQHYTDKISFLHIDCDLYSSTKTILDLVKHRLAEDCIVIFDEMVNYPGFERGELKAFFEFVIENDVSYEWIGMNGRPTGMKQEWEHQNVIVKIHAVNDVRVKLTRIEQKLDEVLCYLKEP